MPVTVYPRLGEVLRARGLTVAELERQIEQRYGLTVDRKTLHRLTYGEPIERVDLEVAGAAAAILDVKLGDLFDIEARPLVAEGLPQAGDMTSDENRRLAELFDGQARRRLSAAEQSELDGLVGQYGHLLCERLLRARASRDGVTLVEARARSESELTRVLAWWQGVEHDEGWRRRLASRVRGRRGRRAA